MAENPVILVAEDEETDVLMLRDALAKCGSPHELQVVEDGESVVDYLTGVGIYTDRRRYRCPKLLLMDIKLPRRSGLEVLQWLRTQPGLRRLPVVILTSSFQPRDIDAAYDLGVSSYLVKPMGLDALTQVMSTFSRYWLHLNRTPDIPFNPPGDAP